MPLVRVVDSHRQVDNGKNGILGFGESAFLDGGGDQTSGFWLEFLVVRVIGFADINQQPWPYRAILDEN